MVCSRVFVFLAITLCLAASVCASNVETDDVKEKAAEAVDDVIELAEKAQESAKASLKQANSILARVQFYNKGATDALSQASSLSQGNANADVIVSQIKETSNKVIALYPNASKEAAAAVTRMQDLVKRANELYTAADIIVEPDSGSSATYTQVNNEIQDVTTKLGQFKEEVQQKVKTLEPAEKLALQMSSLVEKINVRKYHISVILHVSKIETALGKAEGDIQKTEHSRDEVNKTVKEMKAFSKNASDKPSVYVSTTLRNAESLLRTASSALNDAQNAKEEMLTIKNNADGALAKFQEETKFDNIKDEVTNVREYANEVEKKGLKIVKALQLAEKTATTAESDKQFFMKTLFSGKTQLSEEEGKVTNKPKEHVKDEEINLVDNEEAPLSTRNREPDTQAIGQTIEKSSTQQTTEETKEEEQILNSATEIPQSGLKLHQTTMTSETTPIGTSENLIQKTADKPSMEKKEQLKIKSSEILKDKLQKSAKKEANIPIMAENIPAFDVLGDGSMLMSVPLLAALIASAVLH